MIRSRGMLSGLRAIDPLGKSPDSPARPPALFRLGIGAAAGGSTFEGERKKVNCCTDVGNDVGAAVFLML